MEELKKLLDYKLSLEEFQEGNEVSEETKNMIRSCIEKYNNIVSSIGRLDKKDLDDFRRVSFKIRVMRKLAKEYKIDAPDVIDHQNLING